MATPTAPILALHAPLHAAVKQERVGGGSRHCLVLGSPKQPHRPTREKPCFGGGGCCRREAEALRRAMPGGAAPGGGSVAAGATVAILAPAALPDLRPAFSASPASAACASSSHRSTRSGASRKLCYQGLSIHKAPAR